MKKSELIQTKRKPVQKRGRIRGQKRDGYNVPASFYWFPITPKKIRYVPDVVCNQRQQCAEKYLKALLVRHARDFPKTHDLRQLEDLLFPVEADVRLIDGNLQLLNPYGIDIRYPGRRATLDEAKEAVKAMKQIRQFVRAKLGLKP